MMRKIYITGYILTMLSTIGIAITFMIGLDIIKEKNETERPNIVNLTRIKVNPEYTYIQDNWPLSSSNKDQLTRDLNKKGIGSTVTDLKGTVLYENNGPFDYGDRIDLTNHLYADQSFTNKHENQYLLSFPIYDTDSVVGFVIFRLPIGSMIDEQLPNQWIIAIATLSILWLLSVVLSVISYYKSRASIPYKDVINGLEDITKGVYQPLKLPKDISEHAIYISYNRMVEELSYLLKEQQTYEGKRKSFLTTIGHELKTPLAAINAYVEALIKGIAKDAETVNHYHQVIQDKMQRLIQQVDDLFKYAQDDINQFKYHFEEVYADDVFSKIVNPLIGKEDKIELVIKDYIPKCMINIDIIRIEQVILNLYNNAIKHTSNNGKLIIEGYRQENELLISIEDNGEGIDPTDLPYIFDYYYQGNTSKKKDYDGVGLGLAICKEIIDQHGGKIFVKSNLGKGTKFSFTIPVV